jgi:hypothetical protein
LWKRKVVLFNRRTPAQIKVSSYYFAAGCLSPGGMSDLNDNITSYNTGGMTSSLLEVLAGFALSTEEYVDLMLLDLPPSRLLFPPLKLTTH